MTEKNGQKQLISILYNIKLNTRLTFFTEIISCVSLKDTITDTLSIKLGCHSLKQYLVVV